MDKAFLFEKQNQKRLLSPSTETKTLIYSVWYNTRYF